MDVKNVRNKFPLLRKGEIIYFDNACMTLKPDSVIESIMDYYTRIPVCGGRSSHRLATEVTILVEESRAKLRSFINAERDSEVVFLKNTTEALNTVARGLNLKKGDRVVTTDKEHNSNLVAWTILKEEKGIVHDYVPSAEDGDFDLESFEKMMGKDVKLVSMVHTSNIDGTTIPAKEIIKIAHDHGAQVMLDGAQSVPHRGVNVRELDVDYLGFSVHKMCGPTGVGVLYGKFDLLKDMPPLVVGGGTVQDTTYDTVRLLPPPERFEGGLQNYSGLIGAGAAVDFLLEVGLDNIVEQECSLNSHATQRLKDVVKIIGPEDASKRCGVLNFTMDNLGVHDVAMILDEEAAIMTRAGRHCVNPWYNAHGLEGGTRASFYLYNTIEEIDKMVEVLERISNF
jgi:cysteine desulfurase/selenocysteine lyase